VIGHSPELLISDALSDAQVIVGLMKAPSRTLSLAFRGTYHTCRLVINSRMWLIPSLAKGARVLRVCVAVGCCACACLRS
jgi:hypothetical protein